MAFSRLPMAALYTISNRLSISDLSRVSRTSRSNYAAFGNDLFARGARSKFGLHSAVAKGSASAAFKFIAAGADIDLASNSVWHICPYHKTLSARHCRFCSYSNQRQLAWTPLQLAVVFDRPEIAKLLVAHGADVDKTEEGLLETPVFLAAIFALPIMLKLLLDAGATAEPKVNTDMGLLLVAATPVNRPGGPDLKRQMQCVKAILGAGVSFTPSGSEEIPIRCRSDVLSGFLAFLHKLAFV